MELEIATRFVTSPLSEQDLRQIASARDAFRISWQNNQRPEIEVYLREFPESLKHAVLAELLALDVGFRRAAGGACSLADYTARFPGYLETVSKLFDQLQASDTQPTCEVTAKEARSVMNEQHDPLKKTLESRKSKSDGSDDLKNIPEQFGRYRILRELGRGGMGAVYLALDGQLERNVALKIPFFREDDEKEAVERFYREARAMAIVQHANLCPVFDVGRFEEWHFLTMAFIDGQPLSNVLKESNFLSVTQAATLMKTVAVAVQKAHDAGIVHRDLKPANIMLNQDGEPIIMDFGLARRKSTGEVDLTQTGAVFGSPAYMAPEQVEARHDEIGPATDVYALGVILYQLVTGHRPFQGSVMSIFGQILSNVPDPPSKWRQDLPLELDSICMKALAKSPSERHASAAKFAEELSYLVNPAGSDVKTISYHSRPEGESAVGAEIDSTSNNRSRRDAELRQVTVAVFNYESDGDEGSISMNRASMSSQSELLHEQSQSFAAFVNEQAAELGGVTVNSTGQEVLTCFGFPQAFEDAPQRAIRAALQVMRKLAVPDPKGVKLPPASQAWVLLHSGEAVAEEVGDLQGSAVSLVGEARNTALRLSGIVEPGSVVVSAATHQRVALYFECESLGVQRVRGIPQPVELFKVTKEAASRNRVELVDPGNLSPLVGRDTELSILKDRWEQTQDGLGQVVLLIGDAGLGKSRLIRELRDHVIGSDSEGAAVIEWRCAQHQQGTSYFPVVEFLTRLFDFENLSAADRLKTVVRYLRDWKLESTENVSLLCGLLGVATDDRFPALALSPQKVKERTEHLLLQWLKQMVEISSMLFIVEDLHWLDPSTLQLLEKYVIEFEAGRMLSILTFRPEFETPWKSSPHQTQIALNRLTRRQIGEMMRKRTRRREIPELILQQVIERTDGIPLFVEEFTVVIIESGILDRSDSGADSSTLLKIIPSTLHDLLLSRLDRMDADREVIQLASTIGREFGFGLLSAACTLPEAQLQIELDKLVKAEILFKKGDAAEASYIFKHALLQDAANRSMLTKRRQACHQRIAEVIESEFEGIVKSQPALLAHHFNEAGNFDKASQYWLKAGQKSQQQSANVEAISQLTQGLKILQTLPESAQRDQLELAFQTALSPVLMAARGWSAPEVGTAIERAQQLCSKYGTLEDQFFVMWGLWGWRVIRADLDICEGISREIMQLVEKSDDGQKLLPEAYWVVGCTAYYKGDFSDGLKLLEQGLELTNPDQERAYALKTGQHCSVMCGSHSALALWELGYPTQALKRADEIIQHARNLGHPFSYAMALFFGRQVLQFCGRVQEARDRIEEEYKICHEQGFLFFEAHAIFGRGDLLLREGNVVEARKLFDQGLAMLSGAGANLSMDHPYRNIAESFLRSGLPIDAQEWLDRGFDLVENHHERGMESEFLRLKGGVALLSGDEEGAEKYYQKAVDVARQQQARSWELRAMISFAELRRHQRRSDEGRNLLETTYNFFTEGFDTADLLRAKMLLQELESGM